MVTALVPVTGADTQAPSHGAADHPAPSDPQARGYRPETEPEFSDDVDYALNGVHPAHAGSLPGEPSPADAIPTTAESFNGQDEEDWEMSQRDAVDNMLGSEHPGRDATSETGGKDSGEEDAGASMQRRRSRGVNEDDLDETHNPGSGSEVGYVIGMREVPRVVAYHEHVIQGAYGSLVIGAADVAIPGRGIRTVSRSAFLSRRDYDPMDTVDLSGDEHMVGGFFDFVAAPFKAVAHAATAAVHAVEHAASSNPITKAVATLAHDTVALTPFGMVEHVLKGERIDHALVNTFKDKVKAVRDIAPYAQTVVSFVPGLGTGVAGAIAGAAAIAEGKPISAAMIAAVKGSVPGGALGQTAFDIGTKLATGGNLVKASLEAARARLPEAARPAFDIGLAVAQGKKLQDALKTGSVSAIKSLAHQTLVANVADAAKNLVKSTATGGKMLGLSVNVPGVTPHALAAFGSASAALKKISEARAAVNEGETLLKRLSDAHRAPTPAEKAILLRANAGKTVHKAALDNIATLAAAAKNGDPKAKAKVAILNIAKNAIEKGSGQHGHFVTDTGQILKGNFAPA
jgi:hypothetical protein